MKIAGIVAEYNPLHQGHVYHIQKTREATGADFIIAVMSGDFMQRGIPGIVDKYSRTRMALENGIDLVLELPCRYSTASAEAFSGAAVSILDQLGVVSDLSFGSECGEINLLQKTADILVNEPDSFKESLRTNLRQGKSFPAARSLALSEYLADHKDNDYEKILNSPNNILGIEYLKELTRRNSNIHPVTITRKGADYHEKGLNETYSSALSIRHTLLSGNTPDALLNQVPNSVYFILKERFNNGLPIFQNDFSTMLLYKLLAEEEKGYSDYVDISPDLSDRITACLYQFKDYASFCDLLKTKQITHARISRALTHILLNIKKENMNPEIINHENSNTKEVAHDYMEYASILGFKKSAAPLLSAIKANSSIPMIAKNADAKTLLSQNAWQIFSENIDATHIYQAACLSKYKLPLKHAFSTSPVIIP